MKPVRFLMTDRLPDLDLTPWLGEPSGEAKPGRPIYLTASLAQALQGLSEPRLDLVRALESRRVHGLDR